MKKFGIKQSALWLTLAAVLATTLVACDGAGQAADDALVTLTDDLGNTVQITAQVERIISLAPSNTEIAFALGLGDRLVGVSDWSDYPPEALEVQKVGTGTEANLELIVSLDPDLVLSIGGEPVPAINAQLRDLGITVLVLVADDLEGIYHDIELVGQAAGVEDEAEDLTDDMRARVSAVTEAVAAAGDQPLVFYELDATDPTRPWTVGAGSWHDDFITLVGGTNLAGDLANSWVQINAEEIVARDPDIIVLGDANWGITPESVAGRPGWDVIAAVQEGRVYGIDDNLISRQGPRVVDGIEALAKLIHPELFD
ncbi:MAG: cobalamin-binding protein [Anaerolineales bacterium]|nr:MAG: cobalamin-binding protein [Anaerolineales bacterium]